MPPVRNKQKVIDMAQFSAETYKRMEKDFDEIALTQKIYKNASTHEWISEMVTCYCNFMDKDRVEFLKEIPIKTLYSFFHWLLTVRRESFRAASSLQTYWNVFGLIRKNETGLPFIDPTTRAQMTAIRQRLAIEFELRMTKKPKPIMRAEDEFELLKTLWLSDEVVYDHERHRIALALILQLAGITGNRPGALLALRYRHVKVFLLPDATGGDRPRVLMEVKFEETKSYLGPKDANTFGIPDVPSEPCLLLCPQTTFLGLAFRDRAFAAPAITSPDQLFRLKIEEGTRQLEIPWKNFMLDFHLFAQSCPTARGVEISGEKPISAGTLRQRMLDLGVVTGMELPTGAYTFRRGNAEALDCSSQISESQRTLILQHSDPRVFTRNYESTYITADTQAAYRGLDPQTAMMRAASGMSRTIDTRRPQHLTPEQSAQLDCHPELRLLGRRKRKLKTRIDQAHGSVRGAKGLPIREEYRIAGNKYHSLRRRLENAMLDEIKRKYKNEQPVIDIERQLGGMNMKKVAPKTLQAYAFRERFLAIDSLFAFATASSKDECARRAKAISALASLASRQEGRRARVPKQPAIKVEAEEGPSSMDEVVLSPKEASAPALLTCEPTQCIFCLGQQELPMTKRTKSFHKTGDLKKHFHRKHLRFLPKDKPILCPHPYCDEVLQHTMHLQSHAQIVHKTRT